MKKEKKKQRNEVLWKYLEINFMLIYCYYYCYVKFLINFVIKSFHVYLHVKSHFVNQLFEFYSNEIEKLIRYYKNFNKLY